MILEIRRARLEDLRAKAPKDAKGETALGSLILLRSDSILFASGKDAGSILVPVDFSSHSHRALALARYLSSRHGPSLHLLHAVELLPTPLKPGGLSGHL